MRSCEKYRAVVATWHSDFILALIPTLLLWHSTTADADVGKHLQTAPASSVGRDAEALADRADTLQEKGHYREAEPLYRKALTIERRKLGERNAAVSNDYTNLALNLNSQGRYADADPLFRKALDIDRSILDENHPDIASDYNNLADNLNSQGDYAKADIFFRKALSIARATLGENNAETATDYSNVAYNLYSQGRYAEAEPLFRRGLDIHRSTLGENNRRTAIDYNSLGKNLHYQGRYTDADTFFHKALSIDLALLGDRHPSIAIVYNNIAWNLSSQHLYSEADPLYRKALDIDRSTLGESHPVTAITYANLAGNLRFQGRYIEAEVLLRKALKIDFVMLGNRHPDTAIDYVGLADDLNSLGRYKEAESLYREALKVMRVRFGEENPRTAATYKSLAIDLDEQGRRTEAEGNAAQALMIALKLASREEGTFSHLPSGGGDPSLGSTNPFGTIDAGYLRVAWSARALDHGDAFVGRALLAAQALLQSASSRAMIRAAARQAAGSGPLAEIVRKQQDLSDDADALDRQILAALGGKTPADADRLRPQLAAITSRLAALDAQIDRAFPAYRAIVSPRPIALDRIQAALAPDEGLLLLLADGDDIYSFAVSKVGVAWSKVPGDASVLARIAHLRCQVDANSCHGTVTPDEQTPLDAAHSDHFDMVAANAIYRSIVAPVERPLANARRLYVTASGALADLPLGMLVTAPPAAGMRDDDPTVLARASWLADRYAITYLPSVAGLILRSATFTAQGDASSPFDGYGDPSLNGDAEHCPRSLRAFSGTMRDGKPIADPRLIRTLCPLPGSADELRSMAGLVHAPAASVHILGAATETALSDDPNLAQARIIVFSTHGALAGEGEAFGFSEPGLVFTPPEVRKPLANGTIDDGILTASEASRLSLSADWVILSACNTASAAGSNGADGLSALSRGFLYAGAHALLASHWRVADDSASALTDETIRIRELHPEISRALALQTAMKTIRTGVREDGTPLPGYFASWAHPADWAPFTEIADFDR